jgi:threonyl-tRNA synthetase
MSNTLDRIRHSAAHVLAMAAIRLFPDTKIGVGPVTKDGFYYDFEFPRPITWEEVKNIESEMNLIIQENLPFNQLFVPREQAFDILLNRGQIYKSEILRDLPDEEVSFFKTGEEFIDLCRGPHVSSTGEIGPVKLTTLSSSHWKNDETRPELQRISGTAFSTLEELKEFLQKQDAIRQRDFRKLARTLNLTLGTTRDVVYTPEGTLSLNLLLSKVLPNIQATEAKEVMGSPVHRLSEVEENMNSLFAVKNRSYKELPIRYYSSQRHELNEPIDIAEKDIHSVGTVTYKAFCAREDISSEIKLIMDTLNAILRNLGIEYSAQVSAPDLESPYLTQISDLLHRAIVSQTQLINPKLDRIRIDFNIKDTLDREWTITSCFMGPSQQQYITRMGEFTPATEVSFTVVLEQLLAYFIENEEGVLPLWLAPVQAVLIPITDAQHDYTFKVAEVLKEHNLRTDVDDRSETMQAKIRDAELAKIHTIIVIGEKEERSESVSLRLRNNNEIGLVSLDRLPEVLQTAE